MSDLLKFPCEFTIKVVGNTDANIEEIVAPVLAENDVDVESIKITSKQSSGGNYTSLTVTLLAESQEQLDNIYKKLSSNPKIQMVL